MGAEPLSRWIGEARNRLLVACGQLSAVIDLTVEAPVQRILRHGNDPAESHTLEGRTRPIRPNAANINGRGPQRNVGSQILDHPYAWRTHKGVGRQLVQRPSSQRRVLWRPR